MIEAAGLTRDFGATRALDDLSFRVDAGEIVGFLGPNGAGKTTAMRILTCTLPPSAGGATVAGCDVVADPDGVRAQVGFMPENAPLYPEMTVDETLDFVAALKGVAGPGRRAGLADIVERVGLGEVRHRLVGNLSKGYRQRVGLAQALVGDPAILILDEPSAGLDPHQIVEVRELIRGFRGHKTVLLSSHILNEVSLICGRVLILDRGRLMTEEAPAALSRAVDRGPRVEILWDGAREAVLAALAATPGVDGVEAQEGGALVACAGETSALRPLLARAVLESGGELQRLGDRDASLEELFLRLTGGGAAIRKETP